MGQYVPNSFVLLCDIKEDTPEYDSYVKFSIRRCKNVIRKQAYLQKQGVSFSYTDTKTPLELDRLVTEYKEMEEEQQNG